METHVHNYKVAQRALKWLVMNGNLAINDESR